MSNKIIKKVNLTSNELYVEELKYVRKRGAMLRNVVVLSAMIEAHIVSLANNFLKKKDVKYNFSEYQEYNVSMKIIRDNLLLSLKELEQIDKFRKYRKTFFHNLFKSELKRSDFNNLIKQAYNVGLKVIKNLDNKEL